MFATSERKRLAKGAIPDSQINQSSAQTFKNDDVQDKELVSQTFEEMEEVMILEEERPIGI